MIAMMPETELLTLEEAGRRLGGVSKYTVRKWIDDGELEGILIGSRWRVTATAVASYLANRTKPANIKGKSTDKK
ncbi:MAG: hypothetical protein AUG51_20895 [Acidobacteria bacterium 13_1_20CM_3_53_8]|nr:MAG: hypothetical protein AUH05_06540 [Ktedonobacter sp. 13_2_20CM_53_11]OLE51881.1 MAG: hypothetical protein AUG51_20895 [Acidobacteria bacterium 13_1_20CM_3_53_8]